MVYVPNFRNDVFISYAHADNTEGWVDHFEKRLRDRLQQFQRDAGVMFWRDLKLRGADVWSAEIEKELGASAVLISILSPNGIDSNWCQQERQRFEQAAAATGGFRIGNHTRAFKVTKTPLENDRHREIFQTLGYEFYERKPDGRFFEYYRDSPEFEDVFDRLAQDLWERLKELRARALSPEPALSVYVASVPGGLEGWRDAIVQQLAAWNCRVLPNGPLPQASPALREAIDQAFEHCGLSVHCVGPQRGFIAEGEEAPIDVLQIERAREKGVDRMIFQGGELHPAVTAALKGQGSRGFEERITPGRIDVLLQTLEDRVRSLRSAPSPGRALPTVFVLCDLCEWDTALRIKGCLEAERRYAALLPIRDVDDERMRVRDLRETLKTSDAVLVYWGGARESWFREQHREVIGAQNKRRRRPLPALCLNSPPDAAREQYRRPDLPFAQVPDLRCETVRPLFRHLDAAPTGAHE